MNNLIMIFIMIYSICMLMMILSFILSKKYNIQLEKMSPFECGFNFKSATRSPFSIHFFLITIIFLIFDVEISMIIPMMITFNSSNIYYWFITSMMFLIIILGGLYIEWNKGMLKWTY
uniref:NADH dehydrogenase subunit 3 n=1 Tax=Olinga feredayi TaxID=177813 RepID=UPI0028CFF2DC|nr:NADH dehydrogenase subunit 3 [Olinga feredayi]WMQ76539.1 NADH dehydrogenase subunit 3 [Olinga feredayi]